MRRQHGVQWSGVVLMCVAGPIVARADILPTRVVVLTQRVVPFRGGSATLYDISTGRTAQFTDDGTVMFIGGAQPVNSPPSTGAWSVSPDGTITSVVSALGTAPGTPGYAYGQVEQEPQIAGANLFALSPIMLVGSATDRRGVIGGSPTSPVTIAYPGMQVPGMPGLRHYSFGVAVMTRTGFIQVGSGLEGGGVTPANSGAMFQYTGSTPRMLARLGDPAPGSPEGVTYGGFRPSMAADANGLAIILGEVRGPGISQGSNSSAAWKETTGGTQLIYRQAVTGVPGEPAGTVFTGSQPLYSSMGTCGVYASIIEGPGVNSSNNEGIWYWDGAYHPLAREGQLLNPSDPLSRRLGRVNNNVVCINEAGRMLVAAETRSASGTLYNSLLLGSPSGVEVIANVGDQAPGLPTGVLLQAVGALSIMNELGMIAVPITLSGSGVTSTNNFAIYALDQSAALIPVVRKGEMIEYAPGQMARITALSGEFAMGGLNGTTVNARGELLFHARLDNGMAGLFLRTVPSPTSVVPMVVAGLFAGRRRTRSS